MQPRDVPGANLATSGVQLTAAVIAAGGTATALATVTLGGDHRAAFDDLTRIACAAQLLANPGYAIPTVVRVLHFASSSHLSSTARRIANTSTRGLGALGPRGVLQAFVKGNTRSRL
jgi:hypothetical protein